MNENMNEFLLFYFNKQNIDLSILTTNISKLKSLIDQYSFYNNKHKYLSLSCIYGSFLGDSMGSCSEFTKPSNTNHFNIFKFEDGIFAPGEVTDDSEMAMAAAFSYMDCPNKNYNNIQDLLYYYFCIWKNSKPKDIGKTISNALDNWKPNQQVFQTFFNDKIKNYVNNINYYSLANGFLMRISTFIIFYYYTNYKDIYSALQIFFENETNNDIPDELFYLYLDILIDYYKNIEITHPNPENGIVAAIFVIMTLTGMIRNNPKDILLIFKKIIYSSKMNNYEQDTKFKNIVKNVQNKLIQIMNDIEYNKYINVFDSMGYYLHAFKLCLYFLYKYRDIKLSDKPNIYYNIISEICDFGGDTDTNSAIVGTMIGPLIGYKNFGEKYFSRFFNFIPNERTEFISSFMVIYVDFLEKKYFNKEEKYNNNSNYNYCTFNHLCDFFFKDLNI